MARYAVIQSGKVVNVIEADAVFAASAGAVAGEGASVGDAWDGHAFTTPPPLPAPVPKVAEPFYFIVALGSVLNLTETDIDNAIAAMSAGKPKRRLKAWWNKADTFRRRGADMAALAALMPWTSDQVDALFFAADAAMSAEA